MCRGEGGVPRLGMGAFSFEGSFVLRSVGFQMADAGVDRARCLGRVGE